MHEELINFDESEHIYDFGRYYVHFTENLISQNIRRSISKIKRFKARNRYSQREKLKNPC